MCDELGLLAWEEIPWCRGGLGGDRYKEQARRMLRNMIDQHANHPSIIIWGLGNENDWPGDFEEFDKDKIRAFMTGAKRAGPPVGFFAKDSHSALRFLQRRGRRLFAIQFGPVGMEDATRNTRVGRKLRLSQASPQMDCRRRFLEFRQKGTTV